SFGDPCTGCMSQNCPATYCGCYENQDCLALYQCSTNCGSDQNCRQGCLAEFPGGISDAVLLSDCAATTCTMSCGWGDPVEPCTKCILQDCEDEMNTCLADPECLTLYNCLTSCAPIDLACQQGCYADHGSAVPKLQAVLECSAAHCASDCP